MFHSSWPNVWLLDVLMLSEADVMPWSLHQEHRGVWLNRGWLGCGCNNGRKRMMMRRRTRMKIRMMRTGWGRWWWWWFLSFLWLWRLWGGGGGGESSTKFPLRNGGWSVEECCLLPACRVACTCLYIALRECKRILIKKNWRSGFARDYL